MIDNDYFIAMVKDLRAMMGIDVIAEFKIPDIWHSLSQTQKDFIIELEQTENKTTLITQFIKTHDLKELNSKPEYRG